FPQLAAMSTPDQASKTVAFWASQGATSFKAYMNIAESVLGEAIKEAHKHRSKVTGQLCSVDYRQAAALGIDDLEHGPVYTDSEFVPDRKHDVCPNIPAIVASWENLAIDGAQVQGLIQDLIKHHVAVTSTLPVFEASITTRPVLSQRQTQMMSAESLRSYLAARASAATTAGRAEKAEAALKKEMAFELAFVRAGGLLLAGPDPTGIGGTLPGFADQRELELLVEAGFTPLEAIKIGTLNSATFLELGDRTGTIAAGKNADLFIVKGNPAANINDVENVITVFKDGIGYDSAKLIQSVNGRFGQY